MKKYTQPIAAIVRVSNENILAGSLKTTNNKKGFTTSGYEGGFGKETTWEDEDD